MTTEPDRSTGTIPADEDLVPEDDAIIGRVFRWSLAVFVLVGLIVVVVLYVRGLEPPPPPVQPKDPGAIAGLDQTEPQRPDVTFTDVTAEAGIDFVHVNGATGEKLLPETMGGGVAFLDYDHDGDQDLLFVNASHWPEDQHAGPAPTMALYANDGTGRYADVTAESGLDITAYGMGVAVGDYDSDGNTDVFITAVGRNILLRNGGPGAGYRFKDVTEEAGVSGGDVWSTSAGFFDYDRDGDLDLFVCNYVKWSRQIDFAVNYTLNGTDRAYGPPKNFEGLHPFLYRNDGDGTFTDVSAEAGVQVVNPVTAVPVCKALAVVFQDIDRDGWPDIFVANDTTQNLLLINNHDGTFTERGVASGVAYDSDGAATGAMGTDIAHFRNDEHLAVSIGNFSGEMTSLYVSQRDPSHFADQAILEGIGSPTRQRLSFGLFFFDYDLDGRLDLLQANGHLEDEINEIQPSQTYRQPAQLFWNAGPVARSTFVEVPAEETGDLAMPIVGRGAAYADIDRDGDLDVVLTQIGARPLLLRNDQNLDRHWLRVKLSRAAENRDAIGTRVELLAGGVRQARYVQPTRSYLSQVELPVTFGLGAAAEVEALRIVWPDGSAQNVPVDGVDREMEVRQDAMTSG